MRERNEDWKRYQEAKEKEKTKEEYRERIKRVIGLILASLTGIYIIIITNTLKMRFVNIHNSTNITFSEYRV